MKNIFFSYDVDRHGNYKNLIKAWEKHDEYFSFNDNSIDSSINSTNASYIKSKIRNTIEESDVFVVIVNDYTSSNKWVNWECKIAREKFKKVIVIKVKDYFKLPEELTGYYNLDEYIGFNKENIRSALNS